MPPVPMKPTRTLSATCVPLPNGSRERAGRLPPSMIGIPGMARTVRPPREMDTASYGVRPSLATDGSWRPSLLLRLGRCLHQVGQYLDGHELGGAIHESHG